MKQLNFWKVDSETGKVLKKYPSVDFAAPDDEECSDETLATALIMSIEKVPRVYVYWRGSNHIIEVDPERGLSERFSKTKNIIHISDVDEESYAEITHNMIHVSSKKEGKEIAKLFSPDEHYESVFTGRTKDSLFSVSNRGIKKWELKSNAQAQLLAESDKYKFEHLFFNSES